jgi:hypothetical protein
VSRGFKSFRRPEPISKERLEEQLKRMNVEGRFIYWTGEPYKFRRGSLRSGALFALKTPKVPVPLADWIRLAAEAIEPGIGYDPAAVRAGIYLHHDSKPAVYYELKKDAAGNYISVNDIPNIPTPIKAGQIIIEAEAEEKPAQIEVKGGTDIVETKESATVRAQTRARVAAKKGKAAAAGKSGSARR